MHSLSNGFLIVQISAKGAELQSVTHKQTGLEYMWSGDPEFWGKKSPVLFPIVGGLQNNTYQYKGKSYSLSRHGFARERNFVVTEQNTSSITFTLEADAESLLVYPFDFRFSVIYALDKNKITVTYRVENKGNELLYFSVGAHPAFKVPLVEGTVYTDYYLLFNQKENSGKWPLSPEGLIKTTSDTFLTDANMLPLTKELFYADALVFKDLSSNSISIVSDKTEHGLRVQYDQFPYMGIWSAKNADFVCIEPWCGIADSVDASGDITQKEGIHSISSEAPLIRNWSVEVF
jgi:galactose mutarotase-like enzyme